MSPSDGRLLVLQGHCPGRHHHHHCLIGAASQSSWVLFRAVAHKSTGSSRRAAGRWPHSWHRSGNWTGTGRACRTTVRRAMATHQHYDHRVHWHFFCLLRLRPLRASCQYNSLLTTTTAAAAAVRYSTVFHLVLVANAMTYPALLDIRTGRCQGHCPHWSTCACVYDMDLMVFYILIVRISQ